MPPYLPGHEANVDLDSLESSLAGMVPKLAEVYEDLHAHPELSFAEHRTAGIEAMYVAGRQWLVDRT